GAHKVFDKKTGGYFNGQTIVFLFLVTPKVSLPVGFRFYQPDPVVKAWKKHEGKLKQQGIKKSERPPRPAPNPAYPSKGQLLLDLLEEFKFYHPGFVVKAILVDALYGSGGFMNQAVTVFRTQTISQLSKHQKIRFRNQEMAVAQYFATYPGIEMTLRIRGWKDVSVVLGSARLYVNAHQQKRLVMALKDEGEEEYRYRVASDLSGRAVDIAAAYTLRWLLEVFLEDWKLQEGSGRFAPPFGEERSSRGLTLSLLLNYALLFHPEQRARLENPLPACTVGSLQQQSRMDALVDGQTYERQRRRQT
ncbi:MAG TPA: transposase, partial [Candidatus Competibacteraceae bacterium]|nr:transposase [Candidatus Competibacteraceae bacterium]